MQTPLTRFWFCSFGLWRFTNHLLTDKCMRIHVESEQETKCTQTSSRLKPKFHYADFPVSCRGRRRFARFLQSATQMGWLPTCRGNFFKPSRHVAMAWKPETSRGSFGEVSVTEFGFKQTLNHQFYDDDYVEQPYFLSPAEQCTHFMLPL